MTLYVVKKSLYIGSQFPTSEIELTMEITVDYQARDEPSVEIKTVRVLDNQKIIAFPDEIIDQITSDEDFERWLMSEAEDQAQQAAEDKADHEREIRRENAL